VQYTRDEKTDMFQIGRSTEPVIDFIVLDTNMPSIEAIDQSLNENNKQNGRLGSSNKLAKSATSSVTNEQSHSQPPITSTENNSVGLAQSTISRFACRIIVERDYPHTARIYAAGFDTSKRIFLGVIILSFVFDDFVFILFIFLSFFLQGKSH
jgi:pellino protein